MTTQLDTTTVDHATYRTTIADRLAYGWRFAGLYALPTDHHLLVRTLLTDPAGQRDLISAAAADGVVPSIVDVAPAAGWDEREAHDLTGVVFTGHEPLRPLIHHSGLSEWTVPVRGKGPYQVAVGPIHAGIIESGHFRLHVVGDRILHLDARLFYKHRGLETAAQGSTLDDGLAYVARACAGCHVANTVAYAHACEEALGLAPTLGLSRARTLLLELERVWNHLNDIAAICAGVGFAAGNNRFAALTEQARRINAAISGHRFLFGTVHVAASHLTIEATAMRALHDGLTELGRQARRSWRELVFNRSFQERLPDVGILTADRARQLGTVGPAARASGIPEDARTVSPRMSYPDFTPATAANSTGDVRARLEQRTAELWQTLDILNHLTDGPLTPTTIHNAGWAQPIGVGQAEGPRGANTCIVEQHDGRLTRLRLRTASYANWPSVAAVAAGNLLPDFPLINKSFELCYACADR